MQIIKVKNYEEMSRQAAEFFLKQFRQKPNSVFGLAAGSTPVGMYKEIIKEYQDEKLDFSKVMTFNLDEYVGLEKTHPQSYCYFMQENFFKKINLLADNIFIPNGMAQDLNAHCAWYEEQIRNNPIDLQILGIGGNGHIGFNEPGSELESRTRPVNLDEQSIKDNARFFSSIDDVPTKAITMGMATIMQAKRIILLASGTNKAAAVKCAVENEPSVDCPASWLQQHDDVIVIVDEGAGSLLK